MGPFSIDIEKDLLILKLDDIEAAASERANMVLDNSRASGTNNQEASPRGNLFTHYSLASNIASERLVLMTVQNQIDPQTARPDEGFLSIQRHSEAALGIMRTFEWCDRKNVMVKDQEPQLRRTVTFFSLPFVS